MMQQTVTIQSESKCTTESIIKLENPYRILFVDDEPALLDITKLFLERTGTIQVTCCSSGPQALDLILCDFFDAIVSDYDMPEMTGIDLLEKVRSIDQRIPFILFTGRGREEVVIEALNLGADYYISKGGEPKAQYAELQHCVTQAIKKVQSEISLRNSERLITGIFQHLPDATFAVSEKGTIIAWNKAMEHMTHVSSSEVIGDSIHTWISYLYGENRPFLAELLFNPDINLPKEYTITEGHDDMVIAEITINQQKKQPVTLWTKATYLYDEKKCIAGAIESVRDISIQKEAENELIRANEYQRTLIELHVDPLVTLFSDLTISDMNTATEKLVGCECTTIIGDNFCDWFTDPDEVLDILQKVSNGATIRDYPLTLITYQGEHRGIYLYATAYWDNDNSFLGIFAEFHDLVF